MREQYRAAGPRGPVPKVRSGPHRPMAQGTPADAGVNLRDQAGSGRCATFTLPPPNGGVPICIREPFLAVLDEIFLLVVPQAFRKLPLFSGPASNFCLQVERPSFPSRPPSVGIASFACAALGITRLTALRGLAVLRIVLATEVGGRRCDSPQICWVVSSSPEGVLDLFPESALAIRRSVLARSASNIAR